MSSRELVVRTITPEEHLAYLETVQADQSVSFLQVPAWGAVKTEWNNESIGWFDGDRQVGAALVLYRRLPKVDRAGVKKALAYLPEGPVIDWGEANLADYLEPMARHLRKSGAFGIRIGPPVVVNTWSAAQVKEGIADDQVSQLSELAPSARSGPGHRLVTELGRLGWLPQGLGEGFAAGQPRFNFQIRLTTDEGQPRTPAEVLAGMNQLWRRNIKKADKAGVEVSAAEGDEALKEFHDLYLHTAERDGFTPRPLGYFATMRDALNAEQPGRFTLWLARHEGDLVAATIAICVGRHYWYSYGASSTAKRDVRGSNAVQWAMISDAIARGAEVYDLRGITETLRADDSHVGLIQFKVGTGGEAVEYAGEWDLPLNRLLYKAFDLYMKRR